MDGSGNQRVLPESRQTAITSGAFGSVHRTDIEVSSRADQVIAAAGLGKVYQCIEHWGVPVRGNSNGAGCHDAAHPECGGLGI